MGEVGRRLVVTTPRIKKVCKSGTRVHQGLLSPERKCEEVKCGDKKRPAASVVEVSLLEVWHKAKGSGGTRRAGLRYTLSFLGVFRGIRREKMKIDGREENKATGG